MPLVGGANPAIAGRNALLAALPRADFAAFTPYLVETVLDRGAVIHEPGEPITRVCFPHGAIVSLLATLPDGAGVETAMIGREGAVGLSAALGTATSASRAIVLAGGPAVTIPAARVADVAADSKPLRDMIARHQDVLFAQVQQVVVCNTVHPVEQRLCRWLLGVHHRLESDTLTLTQEQLAALLGVQRTTITAICRMLQAENIIDVRRGRIEIRDLAALERRACGCYRVMRALADRARQAAFVTQVDAR